MAGQIYDEIIFQKNKDGNQYAPGAFYIKMKIPTSTGKPQTIFLKRPTGESVAFNSAAYANYTLRDLILNNTDMRMDDVNPNTKEPNYFTTDPSTIRGFLNTQLNYSGFPNLDPTKMKDAINMEAVKVQQQAR